MSDPLSINGSYLRECRESLGWSLGEVASRACLSVKQVKQLEEGGASSFYSDNVKLTAARKVAGILGVSEDELLGTPRIHEDDSSSRTPEHSAPSSSVLNETRETFNQETNMVSPIEVAVAENSALGPASHVYQPIITPGVEALTIRSEALHFLAQPPEEGQDDPHFSDSEQEQHLKQASSYDSNESHLSYPTSESNDSMTGSSEHEHHLQQGLEHTTTQDHSVSSSEHAKQIDSTDEAVANKDQNSSSSASNLFKIIVLFLLALGIAAFFAQKTNEDHSEPPPPLQGPQEQGNSSADSSPKSDDATNPSSATIAGSGGASGTPSNGASGVTGTNINSNTNTANSGATNKAMTPSAPPASSGNAPKPGNSNAGSNSSPSSNPTNSNTLSNNPPNTSNNN